MDSYTKFGEWANAMRAATESQPPVGFAVSEENAPRLRELAQSAGWLTRERMEAAGHAVGHPVAVIDGVPHYAPPTEKPT